MKTVWQSTSPLRAYFKADDGLDSSPRLRHAQALVDCSSIHGWRLRPVSVASVLVAIAMVLGTISVQAQGALTNGVSQDGSISGAGQMDSWTTTANEGDRVTVQVAKLSGGVTFKPLLEVLGPDGTPLGTSSGDVAARVNIQAPATGTFTVKVGDSGGTGTGTYQLQLAEIPEDFTVAPGDEGGALTNGANASGAITLGDLDMWTFSANAGDRIALQVAKLSGGTTFKPMIELFGPDGTRVAGNWNTVAARVDVQAETSGTYTVLISAESPDASGSYQLQLAQVPESFVVPAGDEGGALADGVDQDGTISLGDFDLWTFSASPGDHITLQITELSGGVSFTPIIELFGPGGEVKGSAQGATAATLDTAIETGGTYTVLVSDADPTGSGTYQLHLTRGTIAPAGANVLLNGDTQEGSITTAGQSNTWTFTASVGDSLVVRVGELTTTGFTPRIRLYNPDGTEIRAALGSAAAEVAVTATNSGTFSVVVDDGSNGGNQVGDYRLTLGKTGSPIVVATGDEGGPMTNGWMHTGTIGVGDLDVWSFTAEAGESLVVRVGDYTGTASLIPWVRLYGPDGTELGGGGFSAFAGEVAVQATKSGTFTVIVGDGNNGFGGTGDYRLTLAKTGSPIVIAPGEQGGPMTNGWMHTGTINTGTLDVWSFTAQAGQSLVVRVGDYTGTASLIPWVRLYGPDGAYLGGGGFSAFAGEVAVRATNSGTFTVVVADGNNGFGGTGDYRLTLGQTGSPILIAPGEQGGPMTNGWTHTGTINTGTLDVWSFTAQAGESLAVRVGDFTGTASLIPWVRLYGPDGVALGGGGFSQFAGEVDARATNSGTFTVVVADGNNGYGGTGDYRLTLAKTGSPIVITTGEQGGPMTNGWTHTGTIKTGTLDEWSFTARAGQSLVVRVGDFTGTANLIPWVRLYGPDGAELGGGGFSTFAGEVAVRATESGTFTVLVADGSNGYGGTGDYRLTLAATGDPIVISPGEQGGPMTNGWTHTGTINTGTLDEWSFTAQAGQRVVVRVGDFTGTASLIPWVRLYGPDGAELGGGGFSAYAGEVSVETTNSGIFTVLVADGNNGYGGTGDYRLTLVMTGSPLVISPGDEGGSMTGSGTYGGTIDVGDLDAWTFTACQGDFLSLTATELVAGSTLTPWIRVYGRDGTQLKSYVNASSAGVSLTAPQDGTYLVIVGDGNNGLGGQGTYELAVNGLSDELKVCVPEISGTTFMVDGVGGVPSATFVLLTTTNLATPLAEWTPVLTNQFDQFGVFGYTNSFSPTMPKQFFTLQQR